MTTPGPVVLATTGYLPASTEPVATTRYLPASKATGSYWVPTRINCIGASLRCSAGMAPVIQEIDQGGLAENAGLLVGDSILSVFTAPSPESNMVSKIEVVGIESDQLTHLLQAGATSGRVILQVSRTRGGTEDVFLTEIITSKPPLPKPPSNLANFSARPHLSENDHAEFDGDPAFAFPSPKGRDKRRADEDAEERGNLSLLAEKDAAYATRLADELEKKATEFREKADKLAKLASEHRKDEIYEEIARLSLPNTLRDRSAFSARRTQMLNITADAIPVIPVDPRVKHLQKVVDYSKDEAVKGFMRRNRWLSLSVADTESLSSKVLRLNWVVSLLSISIVVSVIVLILSVAESEVV